MSAFSLLARLVRVPPRLRRERRLSAPRRAHRSSTRLLLEPLEDRTLPTSVGFAVDLGFGSSGQAVAVDRAGNVYTDFGGSPTGDLFLAKYSSSGQGGGIRNLSNLDLQPGLPNGFGRGFSSATSLAVDTAGDVYVGLNGGTIASAIAKFNASGQVMWIRMLASPPGSQTPVSVGIGALAVDSNGNVYATGSFNTPPNNPLTLYKPFPGLPTETVPASVFSLQNDPSFGSNAFIVEFNSSGQLVWYGGLLVHQPPAFNNYYASVNGIAADGAGNVYLGGAFAGSVNFDPNGGVFNVNTANFGGNGGTGPLTPDTFALKLNPAHQLVWVDDLRSIGSGSSSFALGLTADTAGNVFLTGGHIGDVNFDPGPGVHEIINQNGAFVEKLDTNGAFRWVANAVGYNAQGFAVALDLAGNVYTTGLMPGGGVTNFGTAVLGGNPADQYDTFVWQLDANGNPTWAGSMIGSPGSPVPSGGGYDGGRAIAVDSVGDIFVTGIMAGASPLRILPGPGGFDLVHPGTNGFLVKLVQNTPPTANAGGPYSIYEGSSLTLNAGASTDPDGDPLTFSWTINGHANAAIGVNPTLTWSQLQALGIDDGPATFNVKVRVDDGHGHVVDSPATTLTVNVTLPAATLSGPTNGVPGQPRTFTFSATDPSAADQAAGFTYQITWGDGSPVQTIARTAGNGAGVKLDHVYTTSGSYAVQVTATEKDDGTSSPVTGSVTVQSVQLQGGTLAVGGTLGNDTIILSPADTSGDINVNLNDVSQGNFLPTDHILVYGQSGNDTIHLATSTFGTTVYYITVPAFLYGGGTGHDALDASGSSANNVLVGGAGANQLIGGLGRDLLIAGLGASKLHAGSADDILIGGWTDYDLTSTAMTYDRKLAGLEAIMAEWGRTDADYLTRVHHLDGSVSGGLNGSFLLNTTTVHENGAVDTLFGAPWSALDWFFAGVSDVVKRSRAGEVVTTIS